MNAGAVTNSRGGGPERTYSTDQAVALARKAAGVESCKAAVTYRQADYWCRNGALGDRLADGKGSGRPRRWHFEDVTVLAACARVAHFHYVAAGGRPRIDVYRSVAEAVRAGEPELVMEELGGHARLVVELDDIPTALAEISP